MTSNYHHLEEEHNGYDPIDQWECLACFKTIPTSYSLFPNTDHCRCTEDNTFIGGPAGPPQAEAQGQHTYHHEPLEAAYHPQLQSYASSSTSATCPEEPEKKDLSLIVVDHSHPSLPELDVSEAQHRRTSLSSSDTTFLLRRFLVEQDPYLANHTTEHASSASLCVQLDLCLRSQRRGSSSKRSRLGPERKLSSSSAGQGSASCDVDPMAGVGTWDDKGYEYSGEEYPLTMSGLVDCPSG